MTARRLAPALILLAFLTLAWGGGFIWFLHAARTPVAPPATADGIVALTGGAERVETALKLLAGGRARVLLISGVGGAADFAELARRAGVSAALAPRVSLGRSAITTRGNAAETAEWVRANKVTSLIVVTAGYHMPRALTELSRAMPGVTLYPAPVLPPALRQPGLAALRLLAGEYSKWLATEAGLSALGWHDEKPVPEDKPDREERTGG